jgi:hypothetical protein
LEDTFEPENNNLLDQKINKEEEEDHKVAEI